ncbi:hypothetical protein GYMLUDRAFT_74757 [Collybiopsis luxurians FD-317 M1]|uniref:RRM domain-containing protein n=1 Tax=Collybiopsis luxurians FD-317 M1 TaxID=944289 RepID=A0A0D0CKQ3_9AGAR|nr:hypothetical protein GYMLUDRAFT_74757 [Collybiopsis luxurians FD-317 M1]
MTIRIPFNGRKEETEAAVTALNGTELMSKVITFAKARRGSARTPTPGKYHGSGKRQGTRRGRARTPTPGKYHGPGKR